MDVEIKHYMKTINTNEICRTCLSESDEMISIFTENEPNFDNEIYYIYQILMNISSIQIMSGDGLPTLICKNCVESANNAFKFKILCERSENLLQTYLTDDKETVNVVFEENDENKSDFRTEEMFEQVHIEENTMDFIDSEEKLPISPNFANEEVIEYLQENTTNELKKLPKKRQRKNKYKFHLNQNGEKLFPCPFCTKEYKHSASLTVHIRSHTLETPYVCKICQKGFRQLTALTYHIRSHTGETPYCCQICGKKYRQSATLTAHLRVHTGQRPFLCSVCGKSFRQAPDLKYHMRTHTKEKPFMCQICGKRMRMHSHLVQHMRIHTGEKPFNCAQCGKSFPSSTRLKRHEIIHTNNKPYNCDVCSKSFNRSNTLKVHKVTHEKEKPFNCQICSKGFTQAHCLRAHLKTHPVKTEID